MKKKFIIIAFLISVLNCSIIAQDTVLFKYFPLKINNVWVYYGIGGSPLGQGTWYDRYKVTSTVQINNKTYFVLAHTRIIIDSWGILSIQSIRTFNNDIPIRIDSVNLNIYKSTNCGTSSELLVDSLKAKKNDSSLTCDLHGNTVKCADTSLINIFNANRRSKRYEIQAFEGGNEQTYVKDIGITFFLWNQLMGGSQYSLRGCIINGVLYGDTTMIVGIQNISNEIPEQFFLFQNYPNPFNPSTKIKFSIPPSKGVRGMIQLIIYDVLGKEIASLIPPLWGGKEGLSPGTYEVEWDGSNFPSGVYFYKLTTAGYTETRKMVLIK